MIERFELAGINLPVGLLQSRNQLHRDQIACRQQQRIKLDPHLTPGTADQLGLGDIRDALDFFIYLGSKTTQDKMIVITAMKSYSQNWHIVNGVGLDQRLRNIMRNTIKVGRQLMVGSHNRSFQIFPDIETHHQQALPGHRGRIDIFNTRQFVE